MGRVGGNVKTFLIHLYTSRLLKGKEKALGQGLRLGSRLAQVCF
jgi:hypothetical protein